MSFNAYLPTPVSAMKKWLWDSEKLDQGTVFEGRAAMFNTVCAIAGYVFAVKYVERFGINPLHVAAAGILVNSSIARQAIIGHIVFFSGKAAIEAGRSRDVAGLIKALALASFGYFTATPKFNKFISDRYLQVFFPKVEI